MYKKGDKVRVVQSGVIEGLCDRPAFPALKIGELLTVARNQVHSQNVDVTVNGEIVGYFPQRFLPATFNKADLKTGMRVQCRSGEERVVVEDYLFDGGRSPKPTFPICVYDSSLGYDRTAMEIMKVWAAPEKCEDFFNLKVKGVLLFERVEQPVKTQQELEYDQLMSKIEELKQQAEKFKPSA